MEIGKLHTGRCEIHSDHYVHELNKEEIWEKVPLLNNELVGHSIKEGQLVRFSGMVQDMFDPQQSIHQYEVIKTHTNHKEIRCAKYKQHLEYDKESEVVLFDSENTTTEERKSVLCVPVPGLNVWTQTKTGGEDYNITSDRKRNFEGCSTSGDEEMKCQESVPLAKRFCSSGNSRSQQESHTQNVSNRSDILLHHFQGKTCIVYIYDTEGEEVKINEVLDVLGFFSVNNAFDNISEPQVNIPSYVLHAIKVKKIECCNPLVKQINKEEILTSGHKLREELKLILTQVLLGDDLVADYLICHLLSTVYMRSDYFVLGKFPLNIFNLPVSHPGYTDLLYDFLSHLVTKSRLLQMSLEVMNCTDMIPKKNYDTNCLETGLLQMSSNTNLVIDETKLQPGVMNSKGLENVKALNDLITHQTVKYDFKYYPLEFQADVRVLILSEGKTMLRGSCCVPLVPQESHMLSIDDIFSAAKQYLTEPLLTQLRVYLSVLNPVQFDISDDLQKTIEEDFVNMRQESPHISADDLHSQLIIARLMCVSEGTQVLAREHWNAAKMMESQRKARMASFGRSY